MAHLEEVGGMEEENQERGRSGQRGGRGDNKKEGVRKGVAQCEKGITGFLLGGAHGVGSPERASYRRKPEVPVVLSQWTQKSHIQGCS